MKHSNLISISGLAALIILSGSFLAPTVFSTDRSMTEIFVGTSPCAESSRNFLKIAGSDKCDWVKWNLTLYHNGENPAFRLESEDIYFIDNRTSESNGKKIIEGNWKLSQDQSIYPGKGIYELRSGHHSVSFLKMNDNVLHLLKPDNSMMIGDGGQSFTLSRIGKIKPVPGHSLKGSIVASGFKDHVIVFQGRTPCQELAKDLDITTADCNKLKWDLRLFQDAVSFTPTKYELRRTGHRESVIEGKWQVIKTPNDIIYQLDPDKPGKSLYLLQGDKNVLFFLDKQGNLLVGNKDFSYTLNRVK